MRGNERCQDCSFPPYSKAALSLLTARLLFPSLHDNPDKPEARWVSSPDPMTHTETSDVNYNTKYNNNIAWRNVNIVDAFDENPAVVEFIVRNVLRKRVSTRLTFNTGLENPEDTFLQHGQIMVDLGEELMTAWREGGAKGEGMKVVGETQIEIVDPRGASLENIRMKPRKQRQVEMTFILNESTKPRATYPFVVSQYADSEEPIGGVFYIINTQPSEQKGFVIGEGKNGMRPD